MRPRSQLGASPQAIGAHYNVDSAFFELWLDESMTYSCALWDDGDDLAGAQRRKLDLFLDALGVRAGSSLLDVGCGWGSSLARASGRGATRVVGLTLSDAQFAYVEREQAGVSCRLESWRAHQVAEPYDAVLSIGAFEHFARHDLRADERRAAYAEFFAFCFDALVPGGRLGLQTILLENAVRTDDGPIARFIYNEIFPESSLPRVSDVFDAAERWFTVDSFVNHAAHYATTCRAWLVNLNAKRAEAVALVGNDEVRRFEKYLAASEASFRTGVAGLGRLTMSRRRVPLPIDSD